MLEHALPVIYTLFLWWLGTGIVIYLDGLPRVTLPWTLAGATVLLLAALAGIALTADERSVAGAYVAFSAGFAVWAWLEISFYTGYVTGPRRRPCAPGCRGWRHFGHALQVSLYHELALLALSVAVAALTWGAENRTGLWTFLVLAAMHESARLNVFLGVRNLNEEFVPEHLHHLRSFLRRRPMNLLFPVSVSVSTAGLVLLVGQAAAAEPFTATALSLVATLLALAILEHWLLVLPLPAAALWQWGLRSRQATDAGGKRIGHLAGAARTASGRPPLD